MASSLTEVVSFIHLNGPPGIGKSTVARLYAARHPGVLGLDIDQIVTLIGGWQDMLWGDVFEAGRVLAAAMARTHLRGGHDVVWPQLMTNQPEMADFEAAATEAGAEYFHVVLMADAESSWTRLSGRTDVGATEQDLVIQKFVEENGGPAFLQRVCSQLAEFTATKQIDATVACGSQTPEQTCDALEAVLERVGRLRP
jgi:predicted kinase